MIEKQKNSWIPCSERLPNDVDGDYYPEVIVTLANGVVTSGVYRNYENEWWCVVKLEKADTRF